MNFESNSDKSEKQTMSQPQSAVTYEGVLELIRQVTEQMKATDLRIDRRFQETADQIKATDQAIKATTEQMKATDKKIGAIDHKVGIWSKNWLEMEVLWINSAN